MRHGVSCPFRRLPRQRPSNMEVHRIHEHDRLPECFRPDCWAEAFRDKNLFKWTVSSEGRRGEYSAYYRIGAEWVGCERALVVAPKAGMEGIDWPAMLMRCFDTEEGRADGLGRIYDIDFDVPPIKDATLQNILTPLLVVHFVGIVRRIVTRGLKRDYVQKEGNLSRVRGRIGFLQNFRRNVIVGRADRVFCRYSELSVNTCENRLIKRALLFAERIVGRMLDQGQRSAIMLQGRLNGCLAAFAEVDDRVELWEVRRCKRNKLYREYEEAVKLAKMILRRYDNSIDRASAEEHSIPAFWIDMSLLYEHYVLGALRKAYGRKILYQANVTTGKPDFLYVDEERPLILDTKYKPRYGTGTFDVDDIRQLAGYARDRKVLKKLGIQDQETQDVEVVSCVIIYPTAQGDVIEFEGAHSPIDQPNMEIVPMREFVGFYRLCHPLPMT